MSLRHLVLGLVSASVSLALAGCTELADPASPGAPPSAACIGCHGSADSPAPVDSIHTTHLQGTENFDPIECGVCHVVPTIASQAGHADSDRPAEVVFSVHAGPRAQYRPETKTCAGVSCHGADLSEAAVEPVWDPEIPDQTACGSCHGDPPGGDHPGVDTCALCHGETTAASHGDGLLQLEMPTTCDGCHGKGELGAPEDALHASHLNAHEHSAAVPCATCHVVPTEITAAGHLDAPPVDIVFSGLALAGGAEPTWDGQSCSNTACHSAGGDVADWKWTEPSGGEPSCGACHSAPPPAPHPQMDACQTCHASAAGPNTIAEPSLHVDGILQEDTPTSCSACHGDADNDTPAPTDIGHDRHLNSTIAMVACADCHVVPSQVLAEGHVDTAAPAEIVFGGAALAHGSTPTWSAGSCSVGCHGSATPEWAETAPTTCESCHGAPPQTDHPMSDRCEVCHDQVATASDTIGFPALHIDGIVQVTEAPSCSGCHGNGQNPAPSTGAHSAHIQAGVECSECHLVPDVVTAPGHLDSLAPAEVTFGELAQANKAVPSWDAGTRTCAGTWCHTAGGDGPEAPNWDDTSGAAKACGACHAVPPPPPDHPTDSVCTNCHKNTLGTKEHVDGKIDFSF